HNYEGVTPVLSRPRRRGADGLSDGNRRRHGRHDRHRLCRNKLRGWRLGRLHRQRGGGFPWGRGSRAGIRVEMKDRSTAWTAQRCHALYRVRVEGMRTTRIGAGEAVWHGESLLMAAENPGRFLNCNSCRRRETGRNEEARTLRAEFGSINPTRQRGLRRRVGLMGCAIQYLALVDNREDFVLGHDEVFLAVERDFVAGVGGEQHAVALLDLKRGAFAVVQ